MKIGENSWEEFENDILLTSERKQRRKWAWPIPQNSSQFTERVDISATKFMGVISQNALSLITAAPSGGNSE